MLLNDNAALWDQCVVSSYSLPASLALTVGLFTAWSGEPPWFWRWATRLVCAFCPLLRGLVLAADFRPASGC